MDEQLQRRLIRQLKILNFWVTTIGILLLASLAIIGYLMFQMVTFMRDTGQQFQQFQQNTTDSIDLKQKACSEEGALGDYLRQQGNICG